jgi:NitT/TauT family transport system substrate-binding protein
MDAPPSVAQNASANGPGEGRDHLSVNLGFVSYRPYVAPMLVAQALGYFRDAHITVDLHNGSTASAGAVQAVGVGHDDLAWVDLATAATAISEGNPVIAVANVQPKGELGLISLKSAGVTRPKDVTGKTIGSNPSGSDPVLLKVFLSANGISPDQVTIQSVPGNSRLPLLLSHGIDLVSGQGFDYQTLLTAAHQEANVILYGDFGANLIGHGFIANRDKVASQGPAIKAFLTAFDRGLRYTREHMDSACQIYLDTKVIGFTLSMCEQELNGWLPLLSMRETRGKPVGWNSSALWRQTLDRLKQYGGVPVKPSTAYYTNDYVPGP